MLDHDPNVFIASMKWPVFANCLIYSNLFIIYLFLDNLVEGKRVRASQAVASPSRKSRAKSVEKGKIMSLSLRLFLVL